MAYLTPAVGVIGAALYKWDALRSERRIKAELDAQNAADATRENRQRVKLDEIHIDVNSKMAAAKKKIWDLSAERAAQTHAPEHFAAAREAEKDYHEHMEAQNRADERVRLSLLAQAKQLNPP